MTRDTAHSQRTTAFRITWQCGDLCQSKQAETFASPSRRWKSLELPPNFNAQRCPAVSCGAGAVLVCRCRSVHGSLVLISPPPDEPRQIRISVAYSLKYHPPVAVWAVANPRMPHWVCGRHLHHPRSCPLSCLHAHSPACMLACPFACSLLAGTHLRPRLHAGTHARTCMHGHTRARSHARTHARACMHAHMLVLTHAYTRTFACTHVLLLTCTRTSADPHLACTHP